MESLKETFAVRSYEVDAFSELSVPALWGYLQEAAGLSAERLGFGVSRCLDAGFTWVLARQRLELSRAARLGESVEIETWPNGTERLAAFREFVVRSRGEELAKATSTWFLLDVKTRRPVDPGDRARLRLPARARAVGGGAPRREDRGGGGARAGAAVRHPVRRHRPQLARQQRELRPVAAGGGAEGDLARAAAVLGRRPVRRRVRLGRPDPLPRQRDRARACSSTRSRERRTARRSRAGRPRGSSAEIWPPLLRGGREGAGVLVRSARSRSRDRR